MYQILQKFDIHWHDGGPSIAMMCHLRRVSDLLYNWKSCLLCYMKDVVLHCSIFFKWNKLVRVRVRVREFTEPQILLSMKFDANRQTVAVPQAEWLVMVPWKHKTVSQWQTTALHGQPIMSLVLMDAITPMSCRCDLSWLRLSRRHPRSFGTISQTIHFISSSLKFCERSYCCNFCSSDPLGSQFCTWHH